MRYELAILTKVQPTDEEKTLLMNNIIELFRNFRCEINHISVQEEITGRRKLAYPIDGQQEGNYSFFYVDIPDAQTLSKLKKQLDLGSKVSSQVMRYMFIKNKK